MGKLRCNGMSRTEAATRAKDVSGLTDQQKAELTDAFELFDSDGSGMIDAEEMALAMKALGFEFTNDEVTKLIQEMDKDGDATVDLEEFMLMMAEAMNSKDGKKELMKGFRAFDSDGTGKITFKNIKRVAAELGETMSDGEISDLIKEADRDGDNEINESEFLRIMVKTGLLAEEDC